MKLKEYLNLEETQTRLQEVVLSDKHLYTKASAIKKITSQDFLKEIVFSSYEPLLKNEAVRNIEDQSVLFTIFNQETSIRVRKTALARIDDQEKIFNILNDDSEEIRELAIKKLNREFQDIIFQVAKNDPSWLVRYAATWKLDTQNEDQIINLLESEKHQKIRIGLIKKLTNQEYLLELIATENDDAIVLEAIKQLNEESCCIAMKIKTLSSKLREFAASKITKQSVLQELCLNDSAKWVRDVALTNLHPEENLEILKSIVLQDPNIIIRKKALSKIRDNRILLSIFNESHNSEIKTACISYITDQEKLQTLRLISEMEYQKVIKIRLDQILTNASGYS